MRRTAMLSSLSVKITSRASAPRLLHNIIAAPSSLIASRPASSPPLPIPRISLRPISHTLSLRAQITVDVPTMGDSITEGTIVEWCVPTGSHVREGDVLALIETDKVTVDIKADQEGVLVKQLGEVDDEVEVGSGLYVLDTDLVNADIVAPTVETFPADSSVSEVNASLDAARMAAAEVPSPLAATSARVPSIHFLGKEGWKEKLAATEDAPTSSPTKTTIPTSEKAHAPTSVTNIPYSIMYGRPPITNEEMEALILGGAEEAPEVHSVVSEKEGLSGVVFVGGKVVTAGPRGVWLAV